ncbi:MAG: VanZ family protein [Thiotrichales bacterium]
MSATAETLRAGLRYRALWLAIGIAMLGLVGFGSLYQGPIDGPEMPHFDKLVHLLMYATLAAWFLQLARSPNAVWLIMIGLAGYGAALEVLQGFFPPRTPSMLDVVANTCGVLLAATLCRLRCRDTLLMLERYLP